MVIRLGLRRLSNRPRGLNGATGCGGPCRFVFRSASSFCDAAVNRFHQCSTEGSEEKFEQKVAKETKVNQGLGLCHGHPVRTSASLQSSSSSLRSRRTRSRHIGRSPSSGHRGKRRPADTLIRAPCVWATALKHRERLENPRVAEGPSECSSRKPNPQCAFVSFAAFCSNFLRCLLSSIDPSGSSCAAKLDADSRHADTRRCIWLHHLNWRTTRTIGKPESRRRPFRITIAETQSPMRLCFLCCLLFKFSSLPFVEH